VTESNTPAITVSESGDLVTVAINLVSKTQSQSPVIGIGLSGQTQTITIARPY
jgi:hypothetical protein